MMLEERDKALIEEEQKREVERKNLLKYSMEIRAQLEEREALRAREVERIEEEAAAMKKALLAIEKVSKQFEYWNVMRKQMEQCEKDISCHGEKKGKLIL